MTSEKRLCPTERNIAKRIKAGEEDPIISNRALLSMHQTLYHRNVREFDKDMELCKVWNVIVDSVTYKELKEIANIQEKV